MLRGGAGRLLGVAALVHDGVGGQPVLAAGAGHELPDSVRGLGGARAREEGGLDQGDLREVGREALLAEDALDHRDIAAGPSESAGDDLVQLSLKGREDLQDRVVDDDRNVIGDARGVGGDGLAGGRDGLGAGGRRFDRFELRRDRVLGGGGVFRGSGERLVTEDPLVDLEGEGEHLRRGPRRRSRGSQRVQGLVEFGVRAREVPGERRLTARRELGAGLGGGALLGRRRRRSLRRHRSRSTASEEEGEPRKETVSPPPTGTPVDH